jgi:tetratricopeptide (TPR) repeat protein
MTGRALLVLLSLSLLAGNYLAPGQFCQAKSKSGRHLIKGKIERDVMMGDNLMLKGNYAEAANLYRQAIVRNAHNVTAMVGLGMALGKQFKLDAADEELDKALALDPENAQAHVGKAIVAMNRLQSSSMTIIKQKDSILKQAEDQCKQAISMDPSLPEAHYNLGMTYKEQGRLDDATTEFKSAIKDEPKYSDAFAGLGLTKLAQGSLAEAADNFKQAVNCNSSNSTAHYGLGKTYYKQGNVDAAIKELNTALYLNPNSAPTHQSMGEAYETQGNMVAAVKEYQEAIRMKPEDPDAYMHIADIRDNRGDIELAISELRAGVELMPNNPELRLRIADSCLRLEKLDDAIKEYQTTLQMDAKNSQAAKGLTRAYYLKSSKEASSAFFASNEYEQAQHMLDSAIALNPNDMELRLAAAKFRAMSGQPVDLASIGTPTTDGERVAFAEALLAQNKFQESAEQMHIVLANANDAKQAFAVADLALMIKDMDTAEAGYKKGSTFAGGEERAKRGLALTAKAKDGARQDLTLADDLSRKKQLASAIDKYHSAIYGNPRSADARMGLAKTLERVSPAEAPDLREAIVQYKSFMSLTPEMPAKEKEKMLKHIDALDEKAYKLEQKAKQSRRS